MVVTDEQTTPSASELLQRAQAGDAQAFCLLIKPLQTSLLRQAAALTGDLHAAEDLVSETLVAAWTSLPRFNGKCALSTWLCAILIHRHQKFIRRANSRPILLARLPSNEARELDERQANLPSAEPSPADAVLNNESSAQLRRCVELLPEKHREVILLRFFAEASLEEIAAGLDCSVGTVKSRLHHALEKLRQMKMNLPDPKGDKRV